jgi:hypothetical protein
MPAGDGTGPLGQGPGTGRRAGYCGGYDRPGYMNATPGRGRWGGGRGTDDLWSRGGRGWRHRFWATGLTGWMRGWGGRGWRGTFFRPEAPQMEPPMREQQVSALRADLQWLEHGADQLRRRISELIGTGERDATK